MKTTIILSALLPIILLASCKKDNDKAPGPPGPINYNDYANGGVHLEIVNSNPTDYSDDQLYIGVMGKTTGDNGQSAYVDLKTGKTVLLNNLNALPQVVNPNNPTDGGKFIVIGTKMSDMPIDPATGHHSIPIPFIQSGRILFSIGKPLYYYINPGGTSLGAPTKSTNPKDQNYGTITDFMEFTYYSTGRVDNNNVFNFTQTQTVNGKTVVKGGSLPLKPTTSDVLGGTASTGAFNNSSLDGQTGHELDNSLRVTFVAALNRHSILTDAAANQVQYPEDVSKFYKVEPYNYYAAFWHAPGVSYKQLQYGFSYDDDANQSSTIVGDNPAYCTLYFGPVPNN